MEIFNCVNSHHHGAANDDDDDISKCYIFPFFVILEIFNFIKSYHHTAANGDDISKCYIILLFFVIGPIGSGRLSTNKKWGFNVMCQFNMGGQGGESILEYINNTCHKSI